MEEDCRQKEEERVNLELEMTEVKESLKKALSGGVTLGLTIEPKAGSSGLQVRAPGTPQCHRVEYFHRIQTLFANFTITACRRQAV